MRAGRLRFQCTVYHVEREADSAGQMIATRVDKGPIFCEINPARSEESTVASSTIGKATHRITIRGDDRVLSGRVVLGFKRRRDEAERFFELLGPPRDIMQMGREVDLDVMEIV